MHAKRKQAKFEHDYAAPDCDTSNSDLFVVPEYSAQIRRTTTTVPTTTTTTRRTTTQIITRIPVHRHPQTVAPLPPRKTYPLPDRRGDARNQYATSRGRNRAPSGKAK